MKKIFVDMDGVLTDFNKYYTELFGRTPAQVKADRDRKEYSVHWDQFVNVRAFASLDWHEGGRELVRYLEQLDNVQITVLTSAGGFNRQRDVQEQKLEWLSKQGITWPAVVVPGRRYKSGFADSDSLMIDDTYDVWDSFIKAGGSAIHVNGINNTIELVDQWIQSFD